MDKKIDKLYALLDSGNYRQAITQCQSKEYENSDIAKALLVFAYAANRQPTEALTVARAVIAKNCTDDHVLATLGQGLKMIRKDTELIPCYENMLSSHNFNEAGLLEIFTCYCRAGEHKKMQLIAQKLYKLNNKPCYMYWSVCCMVQQVIAIEGSGDKAAVSGSGSLATATPTPFPASNNTMLVLAERMLKKLIYSPAAPALPVPPAGKGKAPAPPAAAAGMNQPGAEELQLYVEVLLRQGKLEAALEALLELHPSTRAVVDAKAPTSELTLLAPAALNDDGDFKRRPSSILLQELVAKDLHARICAALARTEPRYEHDVLRIQQSIVFGDYPDQWEAHERAIDQLRACARVEGEGSEEQRYASLVAGHRAQLKILQLQAASGADAGAAPASKKSKKKKKAAAAAAETASAGADCETETSALNTRYRGPFLAEIRLLEVLLQGGADPVVPAEWTGAVDLVRATPRYLARFDAVMATSSEPPTYLALLEKIDASQPGRSLFREKIACLVQYVCIFGEKQCLLSDIYPYICSLGGGSGFDAALVKLFLRLVGAIADDLLAKLGTISLESVPAAADAAAKKKKAGKDAKQPLYPEPVVLSEPDQRNADRRVLATGLTCMYAKCRQIEYIVSSCLDMHAEVVAAASEEQLAATVGHYKHSLSLTLGGTGGEREVQAGDELLMLAGAQLQDFLQAGALQLRSLEGQALGGVAVSDPAHPDHGRYAKLRGDCYASALQWAELLTVGELTSPYNFVFHLERLEVARATSDVLTAVASFNQCRVKHVQLESMSYVLLPCLYEHGFFSESLAHNKAILHFHGAVAYDTGDQCTKAYTHANYMKCLEMNRFIELCKSSVQLALAKVECAALSVLEKCDSYVAMTDYLASFMEGKLTESQSFLSQERADRELHDSNLDYQILTRLDIRSMLRTGRSEGGAGEVLRAMEALERRARRADMGRRLHAGQCHLQALHQLLLISREGPASVRTFEEFAALRASCEEFLGQMPAPAAATPEVRWKQSVDAGYVGFDVALDGAYRNCVAFLLEAWHVVRGGATGESKLGGVAESLRASFTLLRSFLHVGAEGSARGDKYAPASGAAKTLSAEHVRSLSGLVRCIVGWFPVALAQLCRIAPELCTADCGAQLLEARRTAMAFADFMVRLTASLEADLAELLGSEPSGEATRAEPRLAVVAAISKSQQTSCRRLKECVANKVRDLNKLLGTA